MRKEGMGDNCRKKEGYQGGEKGWNPMTGRVTGLQKEQILELKQECMRWGSGRLHVHWR